MATVDRPAVVTDEHPTYLDELRESGETNMFGAGAYLRREFALSKADASAVLVYWMKTFAARHELGDDQ